MGDDRTATSPGPGGSGALVALAVIAAATLAPAAARGEERPLRVGGTGTAIAAFHRLGESFRASPGGLPLEVFPSLGSTGALRALTEGAVDVAILGRPLSPAEALLPVAAREFARTPFAFAVNRRLPVTGLTPEEVVRIYRAETTRWPGGERIRIVMRSASDTDTMLLRAISPEMSVAVDAALARPGMLVAITNAECNEMIERTPGAIGPTTLLQVTAEPHDLRLLAWSGVPPTLEAMRRRAYPFTKHLLIAVRRDPSPGVRRLLAFLASPAAGEVLVRLGADPVPFSPVE
jgi:phosphate transport system substrate-binding protein